MTRPPAERIHARRRDGVEWLTPREVAEHLHTGVDLIYDACATGGLKHVKLGYRTIRVRRAWVDAWAESNARQFR